MTDPYRILGISPGATDEQIKTAYRELAKKYHPDNYVNNPLSDLAAQKMAEINEAYDMVMASRVRHGPSAGNGGGSSQYADIRRLINSRRIFEADELLNGVPHSSRDAEWHFLKGMVQSSRGFMDDAMASFQMANAMEPGNEEYARYYQQFLWQKQSGAGFKGQPAPGNDCSVCQCCTALWCMDCCCRSSMGC